MKTILFLFMLVLLPAMLVLTACTPQDNPVLPTPSPNDLIGGDTDEGGCLISAGYQWCPSTQQCQRMWETYCPEYADSYKEPGICTREYNPVCGLVEIQCITTPCDPVPVTFGNPCMAEQAGVSDYTFGMCTIDIDSFTICAQAGYPVMESYPRQCIVDDKIFVEEISSLPADTALACEEAQGTWLANFNECEWVSEVACTMMGGMFKECESACRNDPDAEFCTLQCVHVCAFNDEPSKPVYVQETVFDAPMPNLDLAVVSKEEQTIQLVLRNNRGVGVTLPLTGDVISNFPINCNNPVLSGEYKDAPIIAGETVIAHGDTFTLTWTCTDLATATLQEKKLIAELSFQYTNHATKLPYTQTGTIDVVVN